MNRGKTRNPRIPNEIRGISGIRITSKQWYSPIQIGILWVWRYVYVWVCVSLGDGGSVGNQGECGRLRGGWTGLVASAVPFPLATIEINMDEIELLRLQDEALSYLRDNITKDEAYYILTTDKDIIGILIADKKDGSKRIKILDMEYTVEKDDMLLLFDTDGIIDECLLVATYIGVNMYFRRQDVNAILNNINREKVMKYPYIAIQLDNIQTVEKRRVVFEITGHRMDDNKERIDFMFIYFMARLCV